MKKHDTLVLEKILERINSLQEFTVGMGSIDDFLSDEKTKNASAMVLIRIGELTRHFTPEFQNNAPIPLSKMKALRNEIAHKYDGSLDFVSLWNTIQKSIPELKSKIAELLARQ